MAKQDFWDVIAEMMLGGDDDLGPRLEEQKATLRATRCCDKRLGVWVEEYSLEYLYAVLELSDEEFAGRIHSLRRSTREGRTQLAQAIREHVADCPRCALKQGYELEWEAKIRRTCRENRQTLRGLLVKENRGRVRSEAAAADESGGGDAAPKTRAAVE